MCEKNVRDRKFNLILYPDCESHVKALEKIKSEYDYAYILHDKFSEQELGGKDIDENDTREKKAHWHVVLNVGKNPRWLSAVADDLGISDNYVRQCKNRDNSLLYLIHYNNPDKYQFSLNDVVGTLAPRIAKLINDTELTEEENVSKIFSFIRSSGKLSFADVVDFCLDNGVYQHLRRSVRIIERFLDEHNKDYISPWENDSPELRAKKEGLCRKIYDMKNGKR